MPANSRDMSEQTYAEVNGKMPFDWNEFLRRAIAGEISNAELSDAKSISGSWVTCACGNQCAAIPRMPSALGGGPEDELLYALGIEFTDYVVSCEFVSAKETLERIEARSAELLAVMQQPEQP